MSEFLRPVNHGGYIKARTKGNRKETQYDRSPRRKNNNGIGIQPWGTPLRGKNETRRNACKIKIKIPNSGIAQVALRTKWL